MISFKDRFEVVGKLKIKNIFKKDGGNGYELTFDRLKVFSATLTII